MTENPPAPRPAPSQDVERPSRGRSISAVICLVLAGLLTTPAAVAYWGQRTLNDGQRYVATVAPLVHSPAVQDVIATKVTKAINEQVNIEATLNNVFAGVITDRPRLQQLVGPLAAAINGLIDREVRAFLASDQFAQLWTRANARAQQALHRVLSGQNTGAVSLQGNEVVLDVDQVIDQVKQRLVARGLTIVEKVPIPQTDRQIVLMERPPEAGSHDLRVREPVGAVASPRRRGVVPRRLPAGSPPPQDDGADRGAAGGQRPAGGSGVVGGSTAVRRPARGHGLRSRQPGLRGHPARLPRSRRAGVPLAGSDPGGRRLVRRVEQVRHRRTHDRERRPRGRR